MYLKFGLILIAACATLFKYAAAQNLPPDTSAWSLEYSVSGGIAGINQHLQLAQTGELIVGGVTTHASPELMTRIAEFLKSARNVAHR